MGSKAYKVKGLPVKVKNKLNEALIRRMAVIVGEAPGANRLFQDYLKTKNYTKVTIGHARSIRYNAGNWKTKKYGDNVTEREKGMIAECDSAIVIWADMSGVIAENLEVLKRQKKPTFVYEYFNKTKANKAGWIDAERVYDPYYYWKEYMRKKKQLIGKRRQCRSPIKK